jgi:hypothetical protein
LNKQLRAAVVAALFLAALAAQAQLPRESASPEVLERIEKTIVDWERGEPPGGLAPEQRIKLLDTRSEMSRLGTSLAPLIPKFAELMLTTPNHQYDYAFMIYAATSITPSDLVAAALTRMAQGKPEEKIAALAQIGRASSPEALQALRQAAAGTDPLHRLMAVVGMGFNSGRTDPTSAVQAIALNLRDAERFVRIAAANSLRLIGAESRIVAPQLIDYLRTKDNPYMATAAMLSWPAEAIAPARPELEALAADPATADLARRQATQLLARLGPAAAVLPAQ